MRTSRSAVVVALAFGLSLAVARAGHAQEARTPVDTVDGFHRALAQGDKAAALGLLARELVVYEFGVVDPTFEQYAFAHLQFDITLAATTEWKVESRRMGGAGDDWWVITKYKVTGTDAQKRPVDNTTLETMLLHRTGGAFRIVHIHWSTNNPALGMQVPGATTP